MTRIIIEPFSQENSASLPTDLSKQTISEWTEVFQVDFSEKPSIGCGDFLNRCSNLTKLEILSDNLSKKFVGKYLTCVSVIKSPMQSLKSKDSNTPSMRKFLNSIENSYPENYYHLYDTEQPYCYALLDTLNYEPFLESVKPKLKMSNFLRQQLKLFENSPKVLLKAKIMNLDDSHSVKNIRLKTNYQKSVRHF